MALSVLRLRRAITTSPSLLRNYFSAISSSSPSPTLPQIPSTRAKTPLQFLAHSPSHSCASLLWLRSYSRYNNSNNNDDDKISPDTILFEGCDYNHWLITMEFPKDPKPTPEEMVETYVNTLAKVVGSVEEAKKRMYACSTTTYTGFQAVMTEEMSEKFRGLPGVVFILPDSYIDPVNKEYGGDKYINGTIIPRPPPVHYGRQGRYGDRNRNYDRPRYSAPPRDSMPMQQRDPGQVERREPPPFDRQSSMQGDGRNYAPQQNYQNYPPSSQGDGRNYGPQQNYQNNSPTNQEGGRGYGLPTGGDFPPPGGREFGQGERRDFGQPGIRDYAQRDPMPMAGRDYNPSGRDNYYGERREPSPSYQSNYNQGGRGNYGPPDHRDFSQGERRDFAPSGGNYGQGPSSQGERRDFAPSGGNWSQGPGSQGERRDFASSGGNYRQGPGSSYAPTGQGYPGSGEGQRLSQAVDNMQAEQRNFTHSEQTETRQGW